jgi:cytoskeleton protein RodZ
MSAKESIGQQLRQAREAQKLSLEQVAGATLMRARYLRALEEGDYQALPSMAQARGFLRAYASYLKLDPLPMLQELEGVKPAQPEVLPAQKPSPPPESSPALNYEQADAIFLEVGLRLQHQRELLGLSLDDAVRYTHVRRHYLSALETGNLDDLPSPVQGRGMLDNYATFLGMDPEPLLLKFAEGLQARLSVRHVARSDPATRPESRRRRRPLPAPLRRLFSADILIGVTFGIFLIIFVMWGAIRIFSMRAAQTPAPTALSIAEFLLATPSPSLEPTLSPGTLAPTAAQPVVLPGEAATDATVAIILPTGGAPGVQVYLTVLQRAWMRATVDGKVEFEGRVIPGSAYTYVGESVVEILTGNGAALQVFFNQQDLGVLGTFGQVVDRIYTTQGILVPTATITRTPMPAPRVTPTVTVPNLPGAGTAPALP